MRLPPVRTLAPIGLVAITAALAGCFTTAADFRNNAEKFILDDDGLVAALFGDSGTAFETSTCAEPENQDVDTTFLCTGVDTEGRAWEFEVTITGKSDYEVIVSRRPDGA
ncbi:MAG: hypothetical protein WBP59_11555 [Ilumatobacteraceae bacterium]